MRTPPPNDMDDYLTAEEWEARREERESAKKAEPDLDGVITQDRIALDFAEKYAGELRYCHSTKGWYLWTGVCWQRDETDLAFQYARHLGRKATAGAGGKTLKEIRKVAFAGGVERFARGDSRLAVTAAAWDADPFLLGTPAGTVDLRTGALRCSDPAEGITKVTGAAPADSADCPLWRKFLSEATAGDAELMRFLQQWAGYCLTGDVREESLVFLIGDGGNGKGVLTKTLCDLWGDYAVTAVMDTFMTSHGDKHTTDIAMLRGARMVLASETQQGRAWNEAKVHQLSGNDKITARFMRCDNFSFSPSFKLTLSGNFAPVLHEVTDAARRRIKMVSFPYKPPKPDLELKSKLAAEGPAILRWAILGSLDWQANGLVLPTSLREATNEYFAEQNTFRQWLDEACDVELGNNWKNEKSADLYRSWRGFADRAGELPGSAKAFAGHLKRAGIKAKRGSAGVRMYEGIRLRRDQFYGADVSGEAA